MCAANSVDLQPAELAYQAVAKRHPDLIFDSSSSAYAAARESFWNRQQQESEPFCIFQPQKAEQVSSALQDVVRCHSTFAIKGGGHSSNLQGSSVNGGFQFDLVNLNHIEIAQDRNTVKLGPGLRWKTVYEHLNREKLHTVGGRDSTVGVPGFIFGGKFSHAPIPSYRADIGSSPGGLSYHGTARGWGADNLVAAEIVLADGKLITADKDTHADLYRALLGGGAHNFGIVTSLTLRTYPYTGMWGGVLRHDIKHLPDQIAAFNTYTESLEKDGQAHLILDISRVGGETACAEWISYPGASAQNAPIFHAFRAIPTISDTLRVADEPELTQEVHDLTESGGKRNTYRTHSFLHHPDLLKPLAHAFLRAVATAPSRVDLSLEVNHLTAAHRHGAALAPGCTNVLGLGAYEDMLVNVLLMGVWEDEGDDELVEGILEGIGAELEGIGAARGVRVPYVYMNYGYRRQDVVGSYGEENREFLRRVAGKYDPDAVFQTLQVGGFKLGGAWAEIRKVGGG